MAEVTTKTYAMPGQISKVEGGAYRAECTILQGCFVDGDTLEEVLTDIQGVEDFMGDMDFKVAGTSDGITALQMDIKVGGITADIMQQAMEQARAGRLHILERMGATLQDSRSSISSYAPRIVTIQIPVDKIRDVIGPGGKTIRSIIERTGVKIDVEDDGTVMIGSTDEAAAKKAVQMIENLAQLVVCKLDFAQVGRLVLSEPVRTGTLDHHLRPIKVFSKIVGLVGVKEMHPQEKGAL